MKAIEIHSVPHANQRYDTVGDYQDANWRMLFTVSEMKDWRSEAAVAVHELVEYFLCVRARIKLETVDAWDLNWAKDEGEPGDHPRCPYAKQHRFAENIERLLVAELGLTWDEHVENVDGAATFRARSRRSAGAHGSVRGAGAGVVGGADRSLRNGAGAPEAGLARGTIENGGCIEADGSGSAAG